MIAAGESGIRSDMRTGETVPVIVRITAEDHAPQLTDARGTRRNGIAALAAGTTWKPKCVAMEKAIIERISGTGMIRVIIGRTKMNDLKDYIEVDNKKCCEAENCYGVKKVDGKMYCRGCGRLYAEYLAKTEEEDNHE